MIDQITERIAFEEARETATSESISGKEFHSLTERIVNLLEQFTKQFNQTHKDRPDIREVEVIGALSGFLTSTASDLEHYIEVKLSSEKSSGRADLLIISDTEKVILEVKLLRGAKFFNSRLVENYIKQVSNYIAISKITKAIVYVYSIPNTGRVVHNEYSPSGVNGQIMIISTENNAV